MKFKSTIISICIEKSPWLDKNQFSSIERFEKTFSTQSKIPQRWRTRPTKPTLTSSSWVWIRATRLNAANEVDICLVKAFDVLLSALHPIDSFRWTKTTRFHRSSARSKTANSSPRRSNIRSGRRERTIGKFSLEQRTTNIDIGFLLLLHRFETHCSRRGKGITNGRCWSALIVWARSNVVIKSSWCTKAIWSNTELTTN